MDLRTIKNKIKCHNYNNLDEFLLDVLLIFDNCLQYHKRHSKIGKDGATLKRYFEKRCANLGLRDLSLCSPVVKIGTDNSNQSERRVSTRNKKWSTQIFNAFYMKFYCKKTPQTLCSVRFVHVHTAVPLFGFSSCVFHRFYFLFACFSHLSTTYAEFVYYSYCRPLVIGNKIFIFWHAMISFSHHTPLKGEVFCSFFVCACRSWLCKSTSYVQLCVRTTMHVLIHLQNIIIDGILLYAIL
jgi:hypothetical protein